MNKIILGTLFFILASSPLSAQNSNEIAISNALIEFKEAIIENDSESASRILHDDVIILEGTNSEKKEEYLSHHFHSDGKFLSAVERSELSQKINIEGNIAWVSTISSMKGTYSEREIDLTSLELAVLKNENGNWKIVALHWSSR